jgi:hypothetical protein
MNHIKTYKLFEGVYQDLKSELDTTLSEYNSSIKRIKDKYLQDVTDCLVDITDNYHQTIQVHLLQHDDGVSFSDSILKAYLQVLVDYDEVGKFMIDYDEVLDKCNSYLGKDIEVVILILDNNGHYRELYQITPSGVGIRVKSIGDLDKVTKREEGDKISISISI